MLALYIFVIGMLCLSATVRVCFCFAGFVRFFASVGLVTPHAGAGFLRLCKHHVFVLDVYARFMKQTLV